MEFETLEQRNLLVASLNTDADIEIVDDQPALVGRDFDSNLKLDYRRIPGVNQAFGGYGDDIVRGRWENDTLAGGHGNDTIFAAAGDDVVHLRGYGREPRIAQNYLDDNGVQDPDNEIDPVSRTYYANNPIEDNDVVFLGKGRDTVVVTVLISAKEEILRKHADPDTGVINYGMDGVAGENNEVHDHWVDEIGDDWIMDFNPAEDTLQVRGHTNDVFSVLYEDFDGNGVLDTKVRVRSNQGANGGAHDRDRLGNIFLKDVILEREDIDAQDTGANPGLIVNIADLEEVVDPDYAESVEERLNLRWREQRDRLFASAVDAQTLLDLINFDEDDGVKKKRIKSVNVVKVDINVRAVSS